MQETISKINQGLDTFLRGADRKYGLKKTYPPLYKNIRRFILAEGKRIRPLLFILAYRGYSKQRRLPRHIHIAAGAVELLHDYMLIHDDVIDDSSLRRGRPTLHKLLEHDAAGNGSGIGPSLAVVAGDIVFALAVEAFLAVREEPRRKEKALAKLIEAAASTGLGEFIDVVSSHRPLDAIREQDILAIYTLKTARYTFECPLLMGARLAGAGAGELRKLSDLGLAAGRAFQIRDDFLDLFSTEKTIGKSVLTDLAESKKTLLSHYAFENLKGERKELFRQILEKKDKKTKKDLEIFKNLIMESGAYDACLEKMEALTTQAMNICRRLKMKKRFKKSLHDILAGILATSF